MRIVREVIDLSIEKSIRISCAESCTAGLISAALTDMPGSSAVFDCGFVTYSNKAKMDMLGVRQDTLETHGAVSEAVAVEMATGARERADTDLAVAVTGIAGPGGSEHKPAGMVCFGIADRTGTHTETIHFGPRARQAIRDATMRYALYLLRRSIIS
jgi:nicotinamide-nucleotide amidase